MINEQYDNNGRQVWVRAEFKGKNHRICLCYSCRKFHPGTDANCPIAKNIEEASVKLGIVTPVLECPKFRATRIVKDEGSFFTLEELKSDPKRKARLLGRKVMIRSREHNALWREGGHGYTMCDREWEAGLYDFAEAWRTSSHCGPEKGIEYVIVE